MRWIKDLWAWLLGEERADIVELRHALDCAHGRLDHLEHHFDLIEEAIVSEMRAAIDEIKAKKIANL